MKYQACWLAIKLAFRVPEARLKPRPRNASRKRNVPNEYACKKRAVLQVDDDFSAALFIFVCAEVSAAIAESLLRRERQLQAMAKS